MAARRRSSGHKRWTGRGAHADRRKGSARHLPWSCPDRTALRAPSDRRPTAPRWPSEDSRRKSSAPPVASPVRSPEPRARRGPRPLRVSVPTSMPFSITMRLKTSPAERTPWAGFQSYLPTMTRARPENLSESVPASFDNAACVVCARKGVMLKAEVIKTTHVIVLIRIVLMDTSCNRLSLDFTPCPCGCSRGRLHEQPRA